MPVHAPLTIPEFLRTQDGAFVGTFVEKGEVDGEGQEFANTPYRFKIEQWIKGSGPQTMTVWSSQDGGSCGIEARPGQRIGLFVDEQNGRLTSGLCRQVDPDRLLAAISDDVVVGEGPVHFALAGAFEEGSIALLDSQGRPLGYLGAPEQWGAQVEECPGGTTVILRAGDAGIQILDLHTGEGRVVRLDINAEVEYVTDVSCITADGADIRVLTERFGEDRATFTVWAADAEGRKLAELPVSPGHVRPLLVGSKVLLHEQDQDRSSIRLFDPAESSEVVLAEVVRDRATQNFAGFDQAFHSPDGSSAGVLEVHSATGDGDRQATLLVFDIEQASLSGRLELASAGYGAAWLNPGVIGVPVQPEGGEGGENIGSIEIYDGQSLQKVDTVEDWNQYQSVLVGDQLWGTNQSSVLTAPLRGGEVTKTHTFPAQPSGRLVAFEEPFDVPDSAVEPRVGGSIRAGASGLGGIEFEDTSGEVDSGGDADASSQSFAWLPWLALVAVGVVITGLAGARMASRPRSTD